MTGFLLSVPGTQITIQARQLADGSWVQELAVHPARYTGVSPAEKITVSNAVVSSLSPPSGATHAVLFSETNSIRFYESGDTPTTGATGNGFVLPAGEFYEIDLASFAQWKMIAVGSSSTVHVGYRRYGN